MHGSKILMGMLLLIFCSCKAREDSPAPQPSQYGHGAYILCEGNFGWGEGSIHYLDTSGGTLTTAPDAYQAANGFRAGNVVQSLILTGDSAYLVVNNSNKVELLDAHTLKRIAANTTLTSPRYCLPFGPSLLVTDLYAGRVSILDRASLAPQRSLPAPGWTECLLRQGDHIYIANRRPTGSASGAVNEQLLVLQTTSLAVTDSIKLDGQGAQELIALPDGRLLTALEKDFTLGSLPGLAYVDVTGKTVAHIAGLPGRSQQPTRLQQDGDYLFWLQGDALCWMPQAGGTIRHTLPFGSGSNLTSLKTAGVRAGKARLWVADARDYTSAGIVREVELDLGSGIFTTLHETRVGIIPGQIVLF